MDSKTLIPRNSYFKSITPTPKFNPLISPSHFRFNLCHIHSTLKSSHYPLLNPSRGLSDARNFAAVSSIGDSAGDEAEVTMVPAETDEDLAGNESLWNQLVEILKFSGPAAGLWLCGPLMSLIDTAVIGQSSSVELAALYGNLGYGLRGCWWTLAMFQWTRFTVALLRLISPKGILYSEDMTRFDFGNTSTTSH